MIILIKMNVAEYLEALASCVASKDAKIHNKAAVADDSSKATQIYATL